MNPDAVKINNKSESSINIKKLPLGAVPKILLIRNDRMGDLFASAAFIKNLKALLPDSEIDIILSEKNESAFEVVSDYLTKKLVYKKNILSIIQLLFKLRLRKYDCVIDLHYKYSKTGSLISRLSNAKFSLGYDYSNTAFDYTIPLPDTRLQSMSACQNKFMLAFNGGEKYIENNQFIIAANAEKNEKIIGLNLSGSSKARMLSIEKNTNLIKRLNAVYPQFKVRLYTTNMTLAEAETIRQETDVEIVAQLPTINKLIESLAELSFYITPDTATVQLAGFLDLPQVVLYPFTKDTKEEIIFAPEQKDYKPIFPKSGSINNIEVQEILEKFDELMN